jgi:protein-L-isoaspartate(D-aspartate) O-methyltransferase
MASLTPRPRFPARLGPAASPGIVAGKPNTSPTSLSGVAPPQSARAPSAIRAASLPQAVNDPVARRLAMVAKLKAGGVDDEAVLQAFARTERHRFVDSGLANQAYEDTSLPIGLGQTISKPNVVARMLELLRQGHSGLLGRVLEIGTGCGYQAVLLSHLATEVYSMERLRGLHERARDNLRPFRLPNVHLLLGDGMVGFPKGAPYAAIIAAAGGEALPTAWTDQLAIGGRLVAPMVTASGQQALVVVDKSARGLHQTVLEAVHFVPLKSGLA